MGNTKSKRRKDQRVVQVDTQPYFTDTSQYWPTQTSTIGQPAYAQIQTYTAPVNHAQISYPMYTTTTMPGVPYVYPATISGPSDNYRVLPSLTVIPPPIRLN